MRTPDTDPPGDSHTIAPSPTPAVRPLGLFDCCRAWMAQQPRWVHVLAVVLAVAFGFISRHATHQQPLPVAPAAHAEPAPVLVGASEAKPFETRVVGHRWFGHTMRHHVSIELQTNGFKRIGGDATPLSKERADKLVKHLDDETVLMSAQQVGALGDGSFLAFLGQILRWPLDHPEEFLNLLLKLLSLLALIK